MRPLLDALHGSTSAETGHDVEELASRAVLSARDVRAGLRTLLELEPPWVDGDVLDGRGVVWWLTEAGARFAQRTEP